MKRIQFLHIVIFLIIIIQDVKSQNSFEEFKNLSAGVGDEFSCIIDYKLYKSGSSQIQEELTGNFARGQNGSYFKVANTEYIWNDEDNLVVNHDVNIMVLRYKEKQNIPNQIDFTAYDKIADSIYIKDENTATITYHIAYSDSLFTDYSSVDITFHKKRKQPLSLNIYYKDEINFSKDPEKENWGIPILEIKYKNFSSNVDSYMYDLSRFLKFLKNDSVELKSTYSDYEFYNLKQQEK